MEEMTMSDMLHDPLIRLMLRADGIKLGSFALLLEDAANRRNGTLRVGAEPKRIDVATGSTGDVAPRPVVSGKLEYHQ